MPVTRVVILLCALFLYICFYVSKKKRYSDCTKVTPLETIINHEITFPDVKTVEERLSMQKFGQILSKINRIRPVGSENHRLVREFIERELHERGWQVSEDSFTESTVVGERVFTNIIAINKPAASRRIILACHYESKNLDGFFGTIDSAVPCSIILNIASSLVDIFQASKADIAVNLIFFDGEEAFKVWTDTDSLYGSRHLAEKMARTNSEGCSDLSRIDLFVLLDLVGAAGHPFPQYVHCDSRIYDMLSKIENLSKPLFLPSTYGFGAGPGRSYFSSVIRDDIQDDHKPFLDRGVPVLHLIPAPFPPQWHKTTDTIENVDMKSIHDIQLVVATFLCQFLRISPSQIRSSPHLL
uniref:glutaminyl-peptide cyclotransferase n=1 Tax=Mesocestoides corti TaxID=53468 RepID=A0A5K3F2F7_MESCO